MIDMHIQGKQRIYPHLKGTRNRGGRARKQVELLSWAPGQSGVWLSVLTQLNDAGWFPSPSGSHSGLLVRGAISYLFPRGVLRTKEDDAGGK